MVSQRAPGAYWDTACALALKSSARCSKQNSCLIHRQSTGDEQCCRSLHMGKLSLPACCCSVGPQGRGGLPTDQPHSQERRPGENAHSGRSPPTICGCRRGGGGRGRTRPAPSARPAQLIIDYAQYGLAGNFGRAGSPGSGNGGMWGIVIIYMTSARFEAQRKAKINVVCVTCRSIRADGVREVYLPVRCPSPSPCSDGEAFWSSQLGPYDRVLTSC